MPSVGFTTNGAMDESKDDVTPPSVLMEHPPIALFVNGVSAAMNELRPCAPVSLKNVLAQELVKGLQAVSDSLIRYNAIRVLRGNESTLFLSLCQAFMEVAYPYCATCFGRCYPNGAALIIESRSTFDSVSQLLTVSPGRGLKTPVDSSEPKHTSENGGELVVVGNGTSVDDSVLENSSKDQSIMETYKLESRSSI